MKFLVVAAFEPELVRFRELAGTAGLAGLAIEAIGVGVVDAAIGMTRCIARHAPTHALLLGTCGAFPGRGLSIGDVVSGRIARIACEKGAELPPPMRAEEELTLVPGIKSVQITNTVGITVEDRAADADVEHLEAFAVARACAAHQVPCAIVLGVANMVGASGRSEWRANHVEASARAADAAFSFLRTSTTAPSPERA